MSTVATEVVMRSLTRWCDRPWCCFSLPWACGLAVEEADVAARSVDCSDAGSTPMALPVGDP